MKDATRVAMNAILKADGGVTDENRRNAIAAAEGRTTGEGVEQVARAVRVRDAAAALGCCPRTLRRYAAAGLIRPVYRTVGAKKRAVAYTAESINDFIRKGVANA